MELGSAASRLLIKKLAANVDVGCGPRGLLQEDVKAFVEGAA